MTTWKVIAIVGAAAPVAALAWYEFALKAPVDSVRTVALERMENPYPDNRTSAAGNLFTIPRRIPVEWRGRIADCVEAHVGGIWEQNVADYRALAAVGYSSLPDTMSAVGQRAVESGARELAKRVDQQTQNCIGDIVPVGEARQWEQWRP